MSTTMDMIICQDINARSSSSVNMIAAVAITLSTLIITTIIIVLIVIWWLKRRKGKIELTENIVYNCHEIKTVTNEAYHKVNNDVISSTDTDNISQTINTAYEITISDNKAYVQSSSDHSVLASKEPADSMAIYTSPNVSYEGTNFITSDNPAYIPTQSNGENTLEYEYITC